MSRCVAIKKVANTPIGPDSEDYIFCVKDERSGKDNRKQSHMHSHMMCNTFYIVRATSLKLKLTATISLTILADNCLLVWNKVKAAIHIVATCLRIPKNSYV